MPNYSLTVDIDPTILKTLAQSGYNLCFATNIGDTYNVAALTVPSARLTASNKITWTTSYSIAGTQQAFQAGNVVEQGTAAILPIDFGQAYVLNSWSDSPSVNSSSAAPTNGFDFDIGGIDAAAVVYLNISNNTPSTSPIYISPIEIPYSTTHLIPVVKAALWFQQSIQTSTMIVLSSTHAHIVDMTYQATRTTTYHDDGTWTDGPSAKIDYFRHTPAFLGAPSNRHKVKNSDQNK